MNFTTQTHTRLGPDDDDHGNCRRNTDIKKNTITNEAHKIKKKDNKNNN